MPSCLPTICYEYVYMRIGSGIGIVISIVVGVEWGAGLLHVTWHSDRSALSAPPRHRHRHRLPQ